MPTQPCTTPAEVTLGFSSLVARVSNIRVPPEMADAEVLVITQDPKGPDRVAPIAAPDDSSWRTIALQSVGVAKSRNAAIDNASRRYLLFADDDISRQADGVVAAAAALAQSGAAVALARAIDETGALRKNYPDGTRDLKLTNSAKAATYEMLVDVEQVRAAGVRFDERFGAGAPNYLGDEYIFIADCLRAGLRGLSVPYVVALHPTDSSGSRWSVDGDLSARGKALERAWNSRATLAKAAFAWRNRRQFESLRARVSFVATRHFTGE